MQQPLSKSILKNRWAWIPLLLLLAQQSWSQCNNVSQYPSTSIDLTATNSSGATTTITTCNFSGEYSSLINAVSGNSYRFTSSIATDYFTIRSGSSGGPVVGSGTQPLTVTPGVSGNLYAHINSSSACLTDVSCRQTAVQCVSCSSGGCINTTVYPSLNISLNPTNNSGTVQQITSCQFGGEYYSVIDVIANKSYTFSSSVGTDWITVRVGTFNGAILGQGAGAVAVTPSTTSPLFIHNNTDASCGTNTTCRVSSVQCTNCLCQNGSQFPSTAVSLNPTNASGALQIVTSCNFASEYFVLTNVLSPKNYTITSSVGTDWLTVRVGSAGGPVLAQGQTPLAITTTSTSDLFVHINTNSSCGTSSTCRITSVQCTNCASAPPCVVSPTFPTNGSVVCPNSNITLSWPASAGATSYDVYFGTTSTPVFWANTASTNINVGVQTTGARFWQIRPRNAAGPASGCNIWSFTLADNTPPSITCPASVMANNSPATACSAVVTYGAITATDNCFAPSIALQSGLASGSVFPVGVTTIVYRATDGVGLTATCSFTVTVKDVTLPTITCPANIVKGNDLGICGAATTYPTPTATDNCGIASVSLLSGLSSGSVFPVGTTTNVWRAVDVNMNSSTCSFSITVNDTEKPTINCPSDISKSTDFGYCFADLGVNLGAVSVQDNCVGVTTSNNAPNGGVFQVGTTTVTWVAKDGSNNSASCVQNITIQDNEPPVVDCPANINVKTDEGDCIATVSYAASATDNCPGATIDYSSAPGSSFGIGLANIEVTATDGSGNVSSCFFQIFVGARQELCNGLDDDCDGWVDEAQDWTSLIKRFASDGAAAEEYGVSVDISGDYAIVGSDQKNASGQSIGSAYILFRDKSGDNKWGQIAELTAPGLLAGDNFGASVSIANGVAAVGAPLDDDQFGNQGAVYMFHQNPNNADQWDFVKVVAANDPAAADNFGSSVALDGDRLLVGSDQNDASGTNSGAAYVFYRNTGGADNWGQVAKLVANTGAADDNMGASVDLDGEYAIVGAPGVDGLQQNSGAAYIFGRNQFGPDAWGQVARVRGNQAGQNDNFGGSVGISGPWAIVGADRNDLKGADAGAAFIFYKNQNGISNSWGQRQIILEYNGAAGDHFGSGVGIDEPYAVVSAEGDDPFGSNSGGAFVYLLDGDVWVTVGQLTDGGGQQDDALGSCAAISGRNIILGAPLDNNGANADQGAVMVYGGLCNTDARPQGNRDQPTELSLEGAVRCFPVPFSDVLNIELKGVKAQDAQLSILNAMGQEVANLHKGLIEGDMLFQWQANQMADGLYFLRMVTGDKVVTQTIIRTR